MVGGQGQIIRAEVVPWRRAEQGWRSWVTALARCGRGFPSRPRARHPQEAVRTAFSQVDGVEGRLGGGTVAPHPRCCSHAGGEGAARLALQIDAEAVGVLGMLEQEPGTVEGLFTCGAGVAAGLIFFCQEKGHTGDKLSYIAAASSNDS